jgi:hypothetical protein
MSEQAHHLLRMAVRPDVELRLVPEPVGIRDAAPFTVLEFAKLPTVAYLEQPTSAAFLEAEETIAAYERVADELDRRALDGMETRTRIADIGKHRSPNTAQSH